MPKQLDKLLQQLITLHPKYIDLSLNRLLELLQKIDNPHLKLPPIIHIAGTNGKGSTLSYLRHIMMENKFLVHAYISPHLKSFNERIILANKEVVTSKLLKNLQYIKKINNDNPITFFEITTAVAFYLFSKQKADFLILETGLGGRLDATNVVKNSLINIITPIDIDHQEYLGKNIIKITNEKLGIVKKNSNIIIGKQKKKITSYIKEKIKKKKNTKLFYGKQFKIMKTNSKKFTLRYKKIHYSINNPNLLGNHQIENASLAVAAILRLNELGYNFSNRIINQGIFKTKWAGRLEKGQLNNIPVYLDGAHNPGGAIQLLKFFQKQKNKCWLIFGMLNNKDLLSYLKIIKPITLGVIAIKIKGEKNSFTPQQISMNCSKLNIACFEKKSIKDANNFLTTKVMPKNILICGSLYLVGKIRYLYL
jgi:dihydrofolate synthase/folylpolyglutamate synthase